MTITPIKEASLSLEEFLEQDYLEESPAYEYINNEVIRKPMPKTHHSRIQLKLASLIESSLENEKTIAFTELRCTFADRSVVPDIVVISTDKIPFNEQQELENDSVFFAPDWTIEILSPNQKPTRVIDNILFCLDNGTQLGWLIDPDERIIMAFEANKPLKIYRDDQVLPVINNIKLELTVSTIFSWLRVK